MTYSICTLPSLAGVYGCRDNEGGVEVQFNLEAKRVGLPHVVKSSTYNFRIKTKQQIFNDFLTRFMEQGVEGNTVFA